MQCVDGSVEKRGERPAALWHQQCLSLQRLAVPKVAIEPSIRLAAVDHRDMTPVNACPLLDLPICLFVLDGILRIFRQLGPAAGFDAHPIPLLSILGPFGGISHDTKFPIAVAVATHRHQTALPALGPEYAAPYCQSPVE